LAVIIIIPYLINNILIKNSKKASKINVLDAISTLLKTDPKDKGFVVFVGKADYMYVQYTRDYFGLLFNWPIFLDKSERTPELANKAIKVLNKYGITANEENNGQSIKDLYLPYKKIIFNKEDDTWISLNVNVGDNAEEIYNLTIDLFLYVFNIEDVNDLKIDLVLKSK